MSGWYAFALWLALGTSAAFSPERVTPPAYDLEIAIDPANRSLKVSGTVRLPPMAASRDSLRLVLWSSMRDVQIEVVEPASATTVTTDSADGDRSWFLRPARPIPGGAEVVLRFSYRADSAGVPQLRVTPNGSYAGGGGEIWYPRLGFDSLGIGALRFTVPAGETVIATGDAIAAAEERSAGRYAFRVARPSLFGFASGHYRPTSSRGATPVVLYQLRPRADADTIVARAARTLEALTALFGPLPQSGYAIAEVEFGGSVGGTSEFGFFLADQGRLDEGFSLPFFGHEIAHAWWGNLVRTRPRTVGRMVMSEGLAQYAVLKVLETVEGAEAAERFRRSEYPGSTLGGSTSEYFRLSAAGLEQPLTAFEPRGAQVLPMHRMANTRAFVLLDMLAELVGRDRFHAMLRQFVVDHRDTPTSWNEFQEEATRVAGRDLRWFFDDWFARVGAPEYRLDVRATGRRVRGRVLQGDTTYGARIEIEARGKNRRESRFVEVRGSSTPIDWSFPFDVLEVVLDPRMRLLRWTSERRAWATALAGFTRADWDRRFGDRKRAIATYRAALDSVVAPDSHGAEFLLRLGLSRALTAEGASAAARVQLDSALLAPSRQLDQVPFAYLELARLAAKSGDSAIVRRAVAAVASAEAAAGVRTAAGVQARAILSVPK